VRLGGAGEKNNLNQKRGNESMHKKLKKVPPRDTDEEILRKMAGKKFRIYPVPLETTGNGRKQRDDLWFIKNIADDLIEIFNPSTGLSKIINIDQVKEYRTDSILGNDGFLLLRAQLTIDGNEVLVEPMKFGSVGCAHHR
jgi:hypothetical protein